MKLLIAVLIFGLIWLWLVHPRLSGSRRRRCRQLAGWNYAHRGLWNRKEGVPENSMAAFRRAADAGYGIELDVHMTSDGHLVVFHDDTLKRMCGTDGRIEDRTLSELLDLRLAGTGQGIPLLSAVLEMVDGRVPLLIELKMPAMDISLCPAVRDVLKEYRGDYMLQSFNPFGVRWLRRRCPDMLVGQLSSRYTKEDENTALLKFLSTTLLMNTVSRPDFVSYECRSTDVIGFQVNWRLFRAPVFVWTVRTNPEYREFSRRYDGIIFEQILPPARKTGGQEA